MGNCVKGSSKCIQNTQLLGDYDHKRDTPPVITITKAIPKRFIRSNVFKSPLFLSKKSSGNLDEFQLN